METFQRYFNLFSDIHHTITHSGLFRWLMLGFAAGVFAGLAAVLFFLGVKAGELFFMHHLAGMSIPSPQGEVLFHVTGHFEHRPWMIPVLTTGVALLTGWLVSRYIPDSIHSGTDGTDAMIKAFHHQEGRIKPKVALIRGIMAMFTISSGGSAGQEGPISQIGAGIGCFLADKLGLSTRERRIMLLSGAAGGLGAIFRAPLGGALTAIEVIYREDFESEAILPTVLSSVTAYTIFTLFYGTEPIFLIPRFHFTNPVEIVFYLILANACALAGWLYVRSFFFIKYQFFNRIRTKLGIMWTTALGGLLMGLMGMVFPHVLTGGYGWLELAILGQLPIMLMLSIILGKIVATSMTIGSGMSGGMFAPALFVGGMTGGLVGKISHNYFPDIVTEPGGYVLVGMAAFFACVANAPIGPLVMVCEITQGYGLLAPLMLASAICTVLGHRFSLYENQVDNKFDSPAHIGDKTMNILEDLQVKEYYKKGRVTVLDESMNLKALTDIIANTNELYFPVRGADDTITGILPLQDVRKVLFEDCLMDLIVVRDLAKAPAILHPEDDLYSSLLKFVESDYGQIPVVDPNDETHVLGLINRQDVFRAYSRTIKEVKDD